MRTKYDETSRDTLSRSQNVCDALDLTRTCRASSVEPRVSLSAFPIVDVSPRLLWVEELTFRHAWAEQGIFMLTQNQNEKLK